MYIAEHGAGEPLVLLHGGLGAGEMFDPLVPLLVEGGRRVLVVDLPGHGHSEDDGAPIDPARFADELAAVEGLPWPCDVLGYSLGGITALRLALQHPSLVSRLVLVSVPFARSGNHADALAAMDALSVAMAEPMKQSPLYAAYAAAAPDPSLWESHVERTAAGVKVDIDLVGSAGELSMPVLLVYADGDSIRPAHAVEVFAALGGGLRDGGLDGSGRPVHQLAVLPGFTHYDVLSSPLLAPAVLGFLGG